MKVTNLHGNTYEVVGWRFYLHFPTLNVNRMSYNKDILSNREAVFINTQNNKWYMAQYNNLTKLWVLFKLKLIDYNELLDIRKSYLNGNKYHA